MISTVIAIATKIGVVLLKALSTVVTVTTPIAKALAVPGKLATKIALKAGLSANTATKIGYAVKVGTALAANAALTKVTSNAPTLIAKPVNVIGKITIARSFGY